MLYVKRFGVRVGDIGEEKKERIYEPIPETAPIEEPTPVPVPDRELEPVKGIR